VLSIVLGDVMSDDRISQIWKLALLYESRDEHIEASGMNMGMSQD
jgi:hypothetical protein